MISQLLIICYLLNFAYTLLYCLVTKHTDKKILFIIDYPKANAFENNSEYSNIQTINY